MIELSLLTDDNQPCGPGISVDLLSGDGVVIDSAATDEAGVATFDVDRGRAGGATVRLTPADRAADGE